MSSAMNLIIARGFPEMGTAALDGYNNQRQANEVSRSNTINANNAEQDQQFQSEDRARQMQQQMASQGQEAEVQALYQAAEELAQMDPQDPKVQNALRAIGTRLESFRAGSGSGLMGMLTPKAKASQARPVMVQGPNGPVYADAASAVGQQAYVRPQSAPSAPSPPKPPRDYRWADESNPAAGVVPLTGGRADQSAVQAPSPAERQAKVAAEKLRVTNERAFNAYNAALSGVLKWFAGSNTGPLVGRIPAYTSAQQIASGAEAAMVPVLKGLFRSAGEGVFTDKDQDLLIAMAPTRADSPEARYAKVNNINGIVAAKLGMPPPAPVEETQGEASPKVFKTSNGSTVEILD